MDDDLILENDPGVEEQGALKAIQQSLDHWKKITTNHPSNILLINFSSSSSSSAASSSSSSSSAGASSPFSATSTSLSSSSTIDERLYLTFRSNFPTLDVSFITDDDLKNDFAKRMWMNFMISCEGLWLEEFNAISLLRIDSSKPYDEKNTILLPKIQWTCCEIARNRELCNLSLLTPETIDRERTRWLQSHSPSSTSSLEEVLHRLYENIQKESNEEKLLSLLSDLSHFRRIPLKLLKTTRVVDLVRKLATDETKQALSVLTASRSLISAWKHDLRTQQSSQLPTASSSLPPSIPAPSSTNLWAWMDYNTPLLHKKLDLIKNIVASSTSVTIVLEDPTSVRFTLQIPTSSSSPSSSTQLYSILKVLRAQRLSFSEMSSTSDLLDRLKMGEVISTSNEAETLRSLEESLSSFSQQQHPDGLPLPLSLLQDDVIRHREHYQRTLGLKEQYWLSRGCSLSTSPRPARSEFEVEMEVVLPALEKNIEEAMTNLPEELKRLREEAVETNQTSSSSSSSSASDELWFELWSQTHSVEMQKVTTRVGVAQQEKDAVAPECHRFPDAEKLITSDIATELKEKGVVVIDNVLTSEQLSLLRLELEYILSSGAMKSTFQKAVGTREDKITWVSEEENREHPNLCFALSLLKGIAFELNQKGGMRLKVPKQCMASVYDGNGAYYVAHRDNICHVTPPSSSSSSSSSSSDTSRAPHSSSSDCQNAREVTALLYANPSDWNEKDGGSLRCYPTAQEDDFEGKTTPMDILPVGGRLVLFKSRSLLHEVLPTHRRRFALSCWILRDGSD